MKTHFPSFFADRTNGRAYAPLLRSSSVVCVAKRCVLS